MALMEMEQVKDAALKYDKPTLARLAQSGQLSPTIAVMAGMMRDRIVQSEMKPPEPATVAEEVMQPMGQRMGLSAAAQMPQQPQQPRGQGLDQVPVPEAMFDERRMAGGGIVAFQAGGRSSLQDILRQMSYTELQDYQRTGRLPEKYRMMLPGQQPSFVNALAQQEADTRRNQLISNIPMEPSTPVLPTAVPPGGDVAAGLNPNMAEPLYESKSGIEYMGDDEMGMDTGAADSGLAVIAPKPPVEARKTSGQYATEAKSMFDTLYGDYARGLTKPDREAMGLETIDFLERSGVNLNLASQQAARLAEEREELAGDRKEAANLRLIEAGLGILGGESPYAFVNIGKGAAPAVKGFAQDIKDVKKAQRALDRSRDQLEVAQNQMNMGVSSMTQGRYDKRMDAFERNQSELQKAKGDLAVKLMTNDNARDIVTMQMQKPTQYEQAREDYLTGGKRGEFATAYLGARKVGATTEDEFYNLVLKEWGDLKADEKRKLKKDGITNFQQFYEQQKRLRPQGGGMLGGTQREVTTPSNDPLGLFK
jgi:hypothetical protein